MNKTQNRRTFIVRFRQMQNDNQPTWIVSLQNTYTGQQMYFPSVEGFVHFLHDEFPNQTELKDPNDDFSHVPMPN